MRWYVTLTWDGWPTGGSYRTIVETEDNSPETAIQDAREAMAISRLPERAPYRSDLEVARAVAEILDELGDAWHVVDCFDLDTFVRREFAKLTHG